MKIADAVLVTAGVYRGISGTVDSVEVDEYGTDVGVFVTDDPAGLLNARHVAEGLVVHVAPDEVAPA